MFSCFRSSVFILQDFVRIRHACPVVPGIDVRMYMSRSAKTSRFRWTVGFSSIGVPYLDVRFDPTVMHT